MIICHLILVADSMVMGIAIDTLLASNYLGLDHNTHDIGAIQNHFIVVDAAFADVVMLIDILQCLFLPLIWLYISSFVV